MRGERIGNASFRVRVVLSAFAVLAAAAGPAAGEAEAPRLLARVSVATGGAQADQLAGGVAISGDGRFVAFHSEASNLVAGDTNGVRDVFVHDRLTGETSRVSVGAGGAEANGPGASPSLSADGRLAAFHSDATNLVPGDSNARRDVFVHDRLAGETRRVSVSSEGVQGNLTSESAAISADGGLVAFQSLANNLVAGDTNATRDVFVHDLATVQTERVSMSSGGAQGNGSSSGASISGDGSRVGFVSLATNLVPGDTNAQRDAFVRDRAAAQTWRVSVSTAGEQANGPTAATALSPDGGFVALESAASNLVADDTNGATDVFVRDLALAETTRVSVGTAGEANATSASPFISAGGGYVGFQSLASNLVEGDANGTWDIFVRDRGGQATARVSLAPGGLEADGSSFAPQLSSDGLDVAFVSSAANLVADDTNAVSDAFATLLPASLAYTGPPGGVRGQTVELSAELRDPDRGPLRGRPVAFELAGERTETATDEGGLARAEVTLDQEPGAYLLEVFFPGDSWSRETLLEVPFRVRWEHAFRDDLDRGTVYLNPSTQEFRLETPEGRTAIKTDPGMQVTEVGGGRWAALAFGDDEVTMAGLFSLDSGAFAAAASTAFGAYLLHSVGG